MGLKKTLASLVLAGTMLGCGGGPKPPEPQPSYTQTATLANDVNINYSATFTDMNNPLRKIVHDGGVQFNDLTIPRSPYNETLGPLEKGEYTFNLTNTSGLAHLTDKVTIPNHKPEYTCSSDSINLKDKYEGSQVNLDLEGCLTDKNPEDNPVNVTGVELLSGNLKLDRVGNIVLTKAIEETEGVSTLRVNYESADGGTGSTDFTVNTEKILHRMAFRKSFLGLTSYIYSANVDGTEEKQLTTDPNLDIEPRYSPKGDMISFTTNRNGKLEVFLMNADGTNEQPLVTNLENVYQGVWSPDGTKMAVGYVDSGKTGIAIINLEDGVVTKLFEDTYLGVQNSEAGSPRWFDRIIFEKYLNNNLEVFEMDPVQGATQVNLTNNPANDFHATLSSDRSEMIFSSDRVSGKFNETDLHISDRTTGTLRRLTSLSGMELGSDWSLDDILFAGNSSGIFQISIIKSDGTGLIHITSNPNEENSTPSIRSNNPEILIP